MADDNRVGGKMPSAQGLLEFLHAYRSLGPMKYRSFIAAVGLLAVPSSEVLAEGSAVHSLALSADAPVLEVAPRAAGRSFLELPSLEYLFRLHATCAENWRPAVFSLSVADSRITLNNPQLADSSATSPQEVRLLIPAKQLAPVAIAAFCVTAAPSVDASIPDASNEPGPGRGQEMTIESALSAHASLLCTSDSGQAITYVSAPLDIHLVCSTDTKANATQ
jgi:hypothetical protein